MKTTLYTVLCVAVRLGAVFMAVGIFEQIPGLMAFTYQAGHLFAGIIVVNGAGLLVALVLWVRPGLLAWWAAGRSSHEVVETAITADQLQYIALSVLGAWMFVEGLSGCVGQLTRILLVKHEAQSAGYAAVSSTTDWRWVIGYAVMALAGAALALGSRGLVGVLNRLRGYPEVSGEPDPDASTTQDG